MDNSLIRKLCLVAVLSFASVSYAHEIILGTPEPSEDKLLNPMTGTIVPLVSIPAQVFGRVTSINPCAGTVGCWLMNEGTGAVFHDGSGNLDNITCSAPSNFAWQPLGTSPWILVTFPNFNGTAAGCVAASGSGPTNFNGSSPFSVSMWVSNSNVLATRNFISNENAPSTYQGFSLVEAGGNPGLQLISSYPSNYIWVADTAAVTGSFYMVATYDGSKSASGVTIYINGSAVSTTTIGNSLTGSTASGLPIWIAQNTDGTGPNSGPMTNTFICANVMSSATVTLNYNGGTPTVPHC